MKRFLPRISIACVFAVLVASASAGILQKIHHTGSESQPADASKQPDKELYDKAMTEMRKGRYDVARLDLQTLLNTYPESEYQMRAKLAVGDTWFHEGGSAALAQAEGEYKDFITFFPNQPEAAEAQMRVADIYYMQMEKPDRDHTNAERAEAEYRTMIQQYPDSPLVPRAKQRLREVQEVLADRQYEIGSFYASHENWAASIARLQTLTDRYPLYSHSDLALIGLGDAYAGEARVLQRVNIAPREKQELLKAYDDRAAEAYDRVVTHYSMSPHVEDARERLIALNRAVPEPTPAEIAASETEEQSRIPVTLKQRALFLVKRGPSTVNAARVGEPPLADPPQVLAPEIRQQNVAIYKAAMAGKPLPPLGESPAAAQETASGAAAPAPGQTATPAGDSGEPLQLESIPTGDSSGGGGGPAIGASIVGQGESPAGSTAAPGSTAIPGSTAAPAPGAATEPGAAAAAAAAGVPGAQNPGGLAPVAPAQVAIPPVEKPAEAPAQINDVHNNPAQVQTGTAAGAKGAKAPKYDSGQESSSKHKKKKGVKKLNPF